MSGGSAPPPAQNPSVAMTGQQQGNIDWANAQQKYNEIGQTTPYGSEQWNQTVDPTTGALQSNVSQSYSPAQQALLEFQQVMGGLGGATGSSLLANLAPGLSQAPNLEGNANSLTSQFQQGVSPIFEQFAIPQQQQLDTSLRNSGIPPVNQDGSPNPAYWQQMNQLSMTQGNTINAQIAQFQPQAFNEALGQYTAPQSWLQSMFNWSQPASVNQNYAQTPNINMQPGNYNQAQSNYYNQGNVNSQYYTQQANNLIGGGMSMMGSLAPLMMMSDERFKKEVKNIGKTHDGQNLYSFKYKGDPSERMLIGLMAQEVEKRKPEAVAHTPEGIKMVDLNKALS